MTSPDPVEEARQRLLWAFAEWYGRDAATIAYNGGEAALARKTDQTLTEYEQAIVERERARYDGLERAASAVVRDWKNDAYVIAMGTEEKAAAAIQAATHVVALDRALADTPRKDATDG